MILIIKPVHGPAKEIVIEQGKPYYVTGDRLIESITIDLTEQDLPECCDEEYYPVEDYPRMERQDLPTPFFPWQHPTDERKAGQDEGT